MQLPDAAGRFGRRLALLRNFSPEMAQKVSVVLHKRLLSLGEQSRRVFPGFKSAADLMNRLEPEAMKSVLDAIEAEDAKLALNIRNLMFTYDDLLGVPRAVFASWWHVWTRKFWLWP